MVAGSPERGPRWGPGWEGTGLDQARRPSGEAMGVKSLGRVIVRNRTQSCGLGDGGAASEMGTQGKTSLGEDTDAGLSHSGWEEPRGGVRQL